MIIRKTHNVTNEGLTSSMNKLEEESFSLGILSSVVAQEDEACRQDDISLTDLKDRLLLIHKNLGFDSPLAQGEPAPIDLFKGKENIPVDATIARIDNLSSIDIAVACVAGGLGVLVDFLVVKIPKNSDIIRSKEVISQSGSPLTKWIRGIGFTKDAKTSGWVSVLERWFGVNYDTSIINGEKGFCPKTHRLYSLAHDPSPSGLLWALKDAISGTLSYIDKTGHLKIVTTKNISPFRILATPIIWLGHILSDIFTKAGVPIPGGCLLRTLQFGSFGEKRRTIGQVVEYMYLDGYDVRHLMTMSTVNAVIELIIRIYYCLTKEHISQFGRPIALVQAEKEMQHQRLEKLRFCGYTVAVAGNVAKLATYQWNPTAFNLPVWIVFLRTAISRTEYQLSTTREILNYVALRNEIEYNFNALERKLKEN